MSDSLQRRLGRNKGKNKKKMYLLSNYVILNKKNLLEQEYLISGRKRRKSTKCHRLKCMMTLVICSNCWL